MIIRDLSYFYLWIVAPTCEKFSKEIAMTISCVWENIQDKNKQIKKQKSNNKTKQNKKGFKWIPSDTPCRTCLASCGLSKI